MLLYEHRVFSSTLQVSWIDLAAWLGDELDAPFLCDLGEGLRADVRGHGGEDDGGGETGIAAEYCFGSVVAIEITAE